MITRCDDKSEGILGSSSALQYSCVVLQQKGVEQDVQIIATRVWGKSTSRHCSVQIIRGFRKIPVIEDQCALHNLGTFLTGCDFSGTHPHVLMMMLALIMLMMAMPRSSRAGHTGW